ncbi:hypothetical protein [Candidatus Jordarchaeum sp.]|uniref:hypothetical protein n=1 Tax=Candidatus Jordarchaeum sp. TaxID=2823881 RepID=UPI004049C244
MFMQGDVHWWLSNPAVNGLLSIIFGIFIVISIGLLVLNLIKLTYAYNRIGPLIGIALSLLFIGICANWNWFLPFVIDIMGKVVKGLGYYLDQMITYWLLSQNLPTTVVTILLCSTI